MRNQATVGNGDTTVLASSLQTVRLPFTIFVGSHGFFCDLAISSMAPGLTAP